MKNGGKITPLDILMVEDSPTDVMLTREALGHARLLNTLNVVENGVEAMEYLRQQGKFSAAVRPDLILLDLNMPRKNGLEVLAEIKTDAGLKTIPVVILTTSKADTDVIKAYEHHANCYIAKPVDFDAFAEVVRCIENFWFTVVTLPSPDLSNPMSDDTIQVLLIEDNPTKALIVQEELSQITGSRFAVTQVGRLTEALQTLKEKHFEVVLLDLSLPDSDGFETFARLREAASDVPVVVLSGRADEVLAVRAVQANAREQVAKGCIESLWFTVVTLPSD